MKLRLKFVNGLSLRSIYLDEDIAEENKLKPSKHAFYPFRTILDILHVPHNLIAWQSVLHIKICRGLFRPLFLKVSEAEEHSLMADILVFLLLCGLCFRFCCMAEVHSLYNCCWNDFQGVEPLLPRLCRSKDFHNAHPAAEETNNDCHNSSGRT